MDYFYNQNQNPKRGYYDQPVRATGQGMAMWAMILGIGALTTFWTVYFTILLGSIAIVLALLSKGFEKKMFATAKVGIGCSITGITAAIITLVSAMALLISQPDILLEQGRQYDKMVEQMYGQKSEDVLGFSYEEKLEQLVEFINKD